MEEEPLLRTTPPGRVGALRDSRLTPTAYVDRVDLPTYFIARVVDDPLTVGRIRRIVLHCAVIGELELTRSVGVGRVDL